MKLFIREHILLVIVQFFQFCIVFLIFWLAGFRDIKLGLYSMFLGCFFLFIYLMYQYMSRKSFYQRLSKPIASMDEVYEMKGKAPIYLALFRLLKSGNNLYLQDIHHRIRKQEEQLIFMDLWVHQMKTPLSVIDLIARDLDEPHSSDIRDENEKLKTGLNTVLYMSRLRSIRQDFQVKNINIMNILQQVNRENKRFYIRNNVFPRMEMEEEELFVESDEKWLYFMITQLVHNAVKYSAGKSNHIIFHIYKRAGQTVLSIQDFGIGIPKADIRRVFDAFYTGENGRLYKESTGVGLYVTKEVAAYLGHTLDVESEIGKGTTVSISF